MAKVGQFTHGSTISSDVAAIGTSFDITKFHLHQLTTSNTQFTNPIEGLYVNVTNIAGGAAKITARLCCDPNGDYTFLPDTEADIAIGLTTATTGFAVWEFGLPLKQFFESSEVYLFIKVDAGTVTLANSFIVWKE
jgi:hypothetical protein